MLLIFCFVFCPQVGEILDIQLLSIRMAQKIPE